MNDPIGDKQQSRLVQIITDLGNDTKSPKTRSLLREEIVRAFLPYFTNYKLLENIADTALPSNLLQLQIIASNLKGIRCFEQSLADHNKAKSINSEASIKAVNNWLPKTYENAIFAWSWRHSYEELSIEYLPDFVKNCMDAIGDMTESMIAPLSKAWLHQTRIIKNSTSLLFNEIDMLKFGDVVAQIEKLPDHQNLLTLSPGAVPIHQWRNISKHHDYKLMGKKIVCLHRQKQTKEILISPRELYVLLHDIFHIMIGLHLAQRVFYLDNILEKIDLGIPALDIELPPRAKRMNLVSLLSQIGYSLLKLTEKNGKAIAIIQDETFDDPAVREFQIISLAQSLWQLTKAQHVEIHYVERGGKPRVGVRISGDTFRRFAVGEINEKDLFQQSDFLSLIPN